MLHPTNGFVNKAMRSCLKSFGLFLQAVNLLILFNFDFSSRIIFISIKIPFQGDDGDIGPDGVKGERVG